MPAQSKFDMVEKILASLEGHAGMYVVDYRGLSVKEAQEFRRSLREVGAEINVYKNNLVKIALRNHDMPEMDEYLAGPSGFIFAQGDVAASAKAAKTFMKDNDDLEFKAGLLDGAVVTAEQVSAIAELPSREELIAKLLGTLSNPATKIVRTLSEIPASFVRTLDAIAQQKDAA